MKHFAVVDDSMVARMAIKVILESLGFTWSELPTGDALLESLAKGESYDGVFLDITMPGRSGIETLAELRKTNPGIPVVMVTADIQTSTLETAVGLGALGVVKKPVTEEILRSYIASIEESIHE